MHRPFFDVLCLLVIASFILIGPVRADNDKAVDVQKRIDTIIKEIEENQKRLEKDEKKLKSIKNKKKKVLGEIDLNEKKIANVQRNIWKIQKEGKILKQEILKESERYEKAAGQIQEHLEKYSNQLRSMYKRQNVSAVEIFFSSGSVSSLLWGFKMLSAIAVKDMEILESLRENQRTIKTSMEKIQKALDAQIALSETKKREQKTLSSMKKKRKTLLSEIEKDLKLQEEHILQWRREMEKSQAQIEQLRKKLSREVKLTGISDDLRRYNFASHKGKLPWPVTGKVVSTFGLVVDKRTRTKINNRGIEILTRHGEPVMSIAKGKVVWTNFIRGYGNFIMIYHPPDYFTIYGHLSDILVNKDDEVAEGAIIGSAGSTGLLDDREARLLLEVLNGKKPENPLSWLRPDRRRARK